MREDGRNISKRFGAFLSYTHFDDEHDNGRITDLRRRLGAEVQMQRGEAFVIFQDRESISTGEPWSDRVFGSVAGSILLIAVITPSFLRSSACREEVQDFRGHEASLDRNDLIIPILYMPTPGLSDPDDEVAAVLSERQYFDWGDLRFVDLESNKMRKGIAGLAEQVVQALDRSESQMPADTHGSLPDRPSADDPEDDPPGFIELLAEGEDAFPLLNMALQSFAALSREIADITNAATRELQETATAQRPAAARLVATRRYAYRLEIPVAQMETVADEYLDQLDRVDGAMGALTDVVENLRDRSSEDELPAASQFLAVVGELAANSAASKHSIATFRQAIENNYNASKSLRPVFKRLSATLRRLEPSFDRSVTWRDNLSEAMGENQ